MTATAFSEGKKPWGRGGRKGRVGEAKGRENVRMTMLNLSTCRPHPCRNKNATKFSAREKEENNKTIKLGEKKHWNLSAAFMQHHDSNRIFGVKCQFPFFCFLLGEKYAYGRDGGCKGVKEGGEQGVRAGKARVTEADGGELNSSKSLTVNARG